MPGPWRRTRLAISLALLIVGAGCGKKGPPVAPIVRIPAAIDKIAARRVGADVYVTVAVPAENIDKSIPADIGRVEIYGYTGRTAPSRLRWPALGTLIATVPVAPLQDEKPLPPADPEEGAVQGTTVTVRDTLAADELVQGEVDPPPPQRRPLVPLPVAAADAPVPPLRRFYIAVPFSPRGGNGPIGTIAEFVIGDVPDPPQSVQATLAETALLLSWEPSGGLVGFLFDRALPAEPSPAEDLDLAPRPVGPPPATAPSGPTLYNVYRDPPPVALTPVLPTLVTPPTTWNIVPGLPLNLAPLAGTTFIDDVKFGERRCYTVRAVRGTAPNVLESDESTPVCLTAADVFAPAVPTALAAVAAEGAISLIWEPNIELDLAGYLVLRGNPGDATLAPLTATPLAETRYTDATVAPGMRYVYAVVAVDKSVPPNASLPSLPVEETAR